MKLNCSCLPFIASFLFLFFAPDSKLSAQLKVTDVAEKVITLNPNLKQSKNKISQANGQRIQAIFPFNLTYTAGVNKFLNNPNYTYYLPTTSTPVNSWNYSFAMSRKLAWGAVITPSVFFNNTGLRNESVPYSGNNLLANRGAASIKLTQPLLLGMGTKFNLATLRSAGYDLSAAEHQYIFQSSFILSQTFQSYVQYVGAYQSLLIQMQTEATLTKAMNDVNRLIELDAVPASEVVLIQAQLYNQKAMRQLAQNTLKSARNQLGAFMGMEEPDIAGLPLPDTLFPVNNISAQKDTNFVSKWLDVPTLGRGDYMAIEKNISSAELDLYVSKQNIKPKLDLSLAAGYTGISRAQGADQYFNPVTQNIPGMNYTVGINFIFNGKNDLAKGMRVQSTSALDILHNQKQALILDIRNRIKLAANSYINYAQVVGFLTESVKSYKAAYQNEMIKFQNGTTTSFALVQVQNNYLLAKNQLINVLTNLNMAAIEFRHQTGTLIESQSDNTFNFDPLQIFTLPVVK